MKLLMPKEIDKKYLDLIHKACEIRKNAYTPYSNYKVGAALLCNNGKVFEGCNIEVSSYSPTICAERVAIFEAIKCGEKKFDALAIVSGNVNDKELQYTSPCGVCRQVMADFFSTDTKILLPKVNILDNAIDLIDVKLFSIDEILPFGFKL